MPDQRKRAVAFADHARGNVSADVAQLHAVAGIAVLVVAGVFALAALILAWRVGHRPWLEPAWKIVSGLVAVQALLGVVGYITGSRLENSLHWLYGVVAAVILPGANSFAAEAPPRGRAWTFAVAGTVLALVLWRAFSTG